MQCCWLYDIRRRQVWCHRVETGMSQLRFPGCFQPRLPLLRTVWGCGASMCIAASEGVYFSAFNFFFFFGLRSELCYDNQFVSLCSVEGQCGLSVHSERCRKKCAQPILKFVVWSCIFLFFFFKCLTYGSKRIRTKNVHVVVETRVIENIVERKASKGLI